MTVDVPTALLVSGGFAALGLIGTAVGWVHSKVVETRIHALEDAREKMGKRFGDDIGELRERMKGWEAVEDYKHRRRMTAPKGEKGSDE